MPPSQRVYPSIESGLRQASYQLIEQLSESPTSLSSREREER